MRPASPARPRGGPCCCNSSADCDARARQPVAASATELVVQWLSHLTFWLTNSLNPRRISYDGGGPKCRGNTPEPSAMLRVRLKADGRLVEVLRDGGERDIATDPQSIATAAHNAARAAHNRNDATYARNVRGQTGLTQAAFAAR